MTSGDAFADLAAAVRADDVERAKSILAADPSLSSRLNDPAPGESFGGTILRHPVEAKQREMIDLLVRAGADPNPTGPQIGPMPPPRHEMRPPMPLTRSVSLRWRVTLLAASVGAGSA